MLPCMGPSHDCFDVVFMRDVRLMFVHFNDIIRGCGMILITVRCGRQCNHMGALQTGLRDLSDMRIVEKAYVDLRTTPYTHTCPANRLP